MIEPSILTSSGLIENNVLSDPFWLDDPSIIFNKNRLNQFWINKGLTLIEKLNAIFRLSIYLSIILYIITRNYTYIYIGIITALVTIFIYKTQKNNLELYFNSYKNSTTNDINSNILSSADCIKPTVDNPMMNINLITDPRDKQKACKSWNNDNIKKEIDEKYNYNLYRDVGDLYGKSNSQREFYTVPGNTIPNEQMTFAKWCFGQSQQPTCKEDSRYCIGETIFNTTDPVVDNTDAYKFTSFIK